MEKNDDRRWKPYFWCTWLASALSGDKRCEWAHWYRAHFKFSKLERIDDNLEGWRANHDLAVRRRSDVLASDGWRLRLEAMTKFTVKGAMADVGGQSDIVAMKDDLALIEDVKTGKRRDSDWWQVLIYMLMLPKAFSEELEGKTLQGAVLYGDGSSRGISPATAEGESARVYARIKEIAGRTDPPPRSPSATECRFCDIAVCTDRVRGTDGTEGQTGAADEF